MMKNRIVYESQSFNNIFMKNSNSEVHLRNIYQIKNRENKFFKSVPGVKNDFSPFKSNVTNNHKRSISPFDLTYIHKINSDNQYLYDKIKKINQKKTRTNNSSQGSFEKSWNNSIIIRNEQNKSRSVRRRLEQDHIKEENNMLYKRIHNILPVLSMKGYLPSNSLNSKRESSLSSRQNKGGSPIKFDNKNKKLIFPKLNNYNYDYKFKNLHQEHIKKK